MIVLANSRQVESNQPGIHKNLEKTVQKYLSTPHLKPYAQHTLSAFHDACEFIAAQEKPIILDACCGTGESSVHLSQTFEDHCVIAVDKSAHRLAKQESQRDNLLFLQADLLDFYRLLAENNIQLARHYLLYPNPWPKSVHLKRRWHATPAFPGITQLGGVLEVRSNWKTYIEEFVYALSLAGINTTVEAYTPDNTITAFERKYKNSGHTFWRCTATIN